MKYKVGFADFDDIRKMVELDIKFFLCDFINQIEDDINIYQDRYQKNKFQWLVVKEEDSSLVGYINVYHITKEAFSKLSRNEMTERDITILDIIEFKSKKDIYIYIDGFVVERKEIGSLLLRGLIGYLNYLGDRDIHIKGVCALAITERGRAICKKLSMKEENSSGIFAYEFTEETNSKLLNKLKKANKKD